MSIHLPRVNVIFYAASYRCAITESRSFLLPARSDILRESFNKNFTRVIEMWRSSLLFVSMMGKVYCCKGNGSATTITLDQKLEHENVSRKDTKAIYSMKTTLRYELRTLSLNI
jgi:hypothetical protein